MEPLAVGSAVAVSVIAAVFGALVAGRASRNYVEVRRYTTENAVELLELERSEEWNEVRALSPEWVPNLAYCDFSGKDFSGANFSKALLKGTNLRSAILDYCDFSSADLTGADLQAASLRSAILTEAILIETNLLGANLSHADLHNANLGSTAAGAEQSDEVEPSEAIERLTRDRDVIDELSSKSFEALVVYLFKQSGFRLRTEEHGGEVGYDLLLERLGPGVKPEQYIVEVKRSQPERATSLSAIRALQGAKLAAGVDSAYLVTNSEVTKQAVEAAHALGGIEIIARSTLLSWVAKVRARVREHADS